MNNENINQTRHLMNQQQVTTMRAIGRYDNLRSQVKPVPCSYADIKAMRQQQKLIPGQLYRITDYVTTINDKIVTNARSAGHAFDVIVCAIDNGTLNEQAWAAPHDGDTYFKDARLEAWELKYRLDNVQWSKVAGTYVTAENNVYTFKVIGDITLSGHIYKLLQGFGRYVEDYSDYALMETVAEGEQIICYYGDPEDFDPEDLEVVGTASGVDEVMEAGKGTVTWMKDEHGNECPYDFKNVQFKRYMATDSVSGRQGLGGKYVVAKPDDCPWGLSVEDTDDFIWAYTFSSNNNGGEQTDYSLTAAHLVHDNVMKSYDDGLPNNVMFGEYNYCNNFGVNCWYNSFGDRCYNNSFGNDCYRNSWSDQCQYNSFGNNCYRNSFGNNCRSNSFGDNFHSNSFGNNCRSNSFGNNCYHNSFANDILNSTLFDGVQYTQITTKEVRNVQVLNGVAGTSSNMLTLTFVANKTYTQVAAKTQAGALKIYVPGDLV